MDFYQLLFAYVAKLDLSSLTRIFNPPGGRVEGREKEKKSNFFLNEINNRNFFQLRQRPLKLQLCPNEHFPTERRLEAGKLPMEPIEISDMPHMCQFVFDMYNHEMDKYMSKLAKERQAKALDAEIAAKIAPYKDGGKVEAVTPVLAEEEKKIAADIEFEVFEEEPRPVGQTQINGQSEGPKD